MARATVRVRGLSELRRDLAAVGPDARSGLRDALKDAADVVSDEAKHVAFQRDLVDSGALVRGIRPSVRGTRAVVQSTVKRGGYPYSGRYEYGDRLRPFLQPALENKQNEVVEQFRRGVDDLLDRHNL